MHAPKTTPYAPLRQQPTAATITVRALLQKVLNGEVRIPTFQRPLRWRQSDVIELLDSVWRGYPIGSLLFWKRNADAAVVRVGSATFDAPPRAGAWWMVDGQQRCTALAASLSELEQGRDPRWDVVFDPEAQAFKAGPVAPSRVGRDVPVRALGDLRRLLHWLKDCELEEEAQATVEVAQQRLLDYSIPAYVVETDDEQALRAVFARTNSTGARMRTDEVFQALLGSTSSDPAGPDLDRLQAECDLDGFGAPSRAEILKAVLAMSGHDPMARLTDFKQLPSLVSADEARNALMLTVDFLRAEAHIPHVSLIPYPVVFVLLAKWFHEHPQSHEANRSRLGRWVWRGAETGVHQRAAVSAMRAQAGDIDQDEDRSIERLSAHVKKLGPSTPWELRRFNLKSAQSRIETLALFDRGPRDEHGVVRIAELVHDGRVAREIFRASEWKGGGEALVRRARTAANRVLLGGAQTGLGVVLKRFEWPRDREVLLSHLVDESALRCLNAHDLAGFLEWRAQEVRKCVEQFLADRCHWGEPDLAPLETYRI